MPRASKPKHKSKEKIPSYRLHKASGRAIVTLPVPGQFRGRDVLLGKFGTPESHERYSRVIREWKVTGGLPSPQDDITIVELVDRYWQHVTSYYVKDGKPTSEPEAINSALQPLLDLYGSSAARSFGPLALKAVRSAMIDKGWCRSNLNRQVGRVKSLFKWAVENELVPPSVYHGLSAVAGIRKGRTEVRESEPVRPVPEEFVYGIKEHVAPAVWAMIQLQLHTGARPGEICIIRGCDLETSGKVWFYTPETHKTEHHGHRRRIPIGPQAQGVLRPWLKTNTRAYLFSPADELSLVDGDRSRRGLRLRDRQRPPGDHYTVASYRRAIDRGCRLAFPHPDERFHPRPKKSVKVGRQKMETKKDVRARLTDADKVELRRWDREHSWHPHQLRHNAATRFRKHAGLEAARVILGHKTAAITEMYAEIDEAKAASIIAEVG